MFVLLGAALLVAVASGATPQDVSDPTLVVTLPQGMVEGVRENLEGDRFYYSFRGIPFAEPPVGPLRFKDPVPAKPWNGLRKGVTPPVCWQMEMFSSMSGNGPPKPVGDEDCLYLHVYSPKPTSSGLPVMVFIHGGAFVAGDADLLGMFPKLLLRSDIVLVSIQYRVNTFGFLSTGDSVIPGNFGLKDQTFALKWVHDNIHHFGGDPNEVTILGGSAGSASVHYQTLTPYSEGLFQRGIMQSGSAISSWAFRDDHAEFAAKIGRDLNCPGADSSPVDSAKLLACFQKASAEDLTMAPLRHTKMNFSFLMVPRVDGDYIPAHPAQLLREGRYHKVNLLTGVDQHEGAIVTKFLYAMEKAKFEESFNEVAPASLWMDTEENNQYLARRAFYQYMDKIEFTEDSADDIVKLMSDAFMSISQDEASIFHGRDTEYGKQIYRYEVQHLGTKGFSDMMLPGVLPTKKWIDHCEEAKYFSQGSAMMPSMERPIDHFFSEILTTMWTNFARTGNPTPDMELGFKWEPMTSSSDLRYLSLTASPEMKEDNRKEIREFWRNMPLKRNKLMFPERFQRTKGNCKR